VPPACYPLSLHDALPIFSALLAAAVAEQPAGEDRGAIVAGLEEFLLERLRSYYTAAGVSAEVFAAVAATGVRRLVDFDRRVAARSEEHTSELQSRFDLVC